MTANWKGPKMSMRRRVRKWVLALAVAATIVAGWAMNGANAPQSIAANWSTKPSFEPGPPDWDVKPSSEPTPPAKGA